MGFGEICLQSQPAAWPLMGSASYDPSGEREQLAFVRQSAQRLAAEATHLAPAHAAAKPWEKTSGTPSLPHSACGFPR
jgi:hypothetical protein